LVALILAIQGLIGLNATQQSLKTVYEDRLVPLRDLGVINKSGVQADLKKGGALC
jgi:methyl-accepting chemotaxis protein